MSLVEAVGNYLDDRERENAKESLEDLKSKFWENINFDKFEKPIELIEARLKRKEDLKKASENIKELEEILEIYYGDFQKSLTSDTKKLVNIEVNKLWVSLKQWLNIVEIREKIEQIIDRELDQLEDTINPFSEKTIRDYVESCIDIKWKLESIYNWYKISNFFYFFTIKYLELKWPNSMYETDLDYLDIDYYQLIDLIEQVKKYQIDLDSKVSFKIRWMEITFDDIRDIEVRKTEIETPLTKMSNKENPDTIVNKNKVKKTELKGDKKEKENKVEIVTEENLVSARHNLKEALNILSKYINLEKYGISENSVFNILFPLMIKETHLRHQSISKSWAVWYFQILWWAKEDVENFLGKSLDENNPVENCILWVVYFKVILEKYLKSFEFEKWEKVNFKLFAYNIWIWKLRWFLKEYRESQNQKIIWEDFAKWLVKKNWYTGESKLKESTTYNLEYNDWFNGENPDIKIKEAVDYVEIIRVLQGESYHERLKWYNKEHKVTKWETLYRILNQYWIKYSKRLKEELVKYNSLFWVDDIINLKIWQIIHIPKKMIVKLN